MDEEYIEFRETVFQNIRRYAILLEIYESYDKNIWNRKADLHIAEPRYTWALYFLGNALVIDIYITLRRLLSKGKDEYSLYQFSTKYLKDPICSISVCELDEPLLKRILPNSNQQWEDLKKFIDKEIAHSDKKRKSSFFL